MDKTKAGTQPNTQAPQAGQTDERLTAIRDKVKNQERLTPEEQDMFDKDEESRNK